MFKFSLQTALDVRSRQEKIKMKNLAVALAFEQSIQKEIERIHENTNQADLDLNEKKKSNITSIDQMMFLSRFKARMKIVLAKTRKRLKDAQGVVAEKQKELIEASKARKTLEILKEKEIKRFQEKIARIEQKSMDEIAGNLFIRNSVNNRV
ncbi:flagellar export protein FliJ [bacterium]|nr:flagellar export protein FliJ [bacterium]